MGGSFLARESLELQAASTPNPVLSQYGRPGTAGVSPAMSAQREPGFVVLKQQQCSLERTFFLY